MVSAINPTKPATGALALKADMRANFLAAKNEIEALQLEGSYWLNVKAFGAKGDTVEMDGAGSITSGSSTLTVAGANFTTADVGKGIQINGAGQAGTPSGTKSLCTTIASRVSATQVTLAAAAQTTVSSAYVMWGSDDTNAIQAAIASAQANGAAVFIPAGKYKVMPQTNPAGITLTYDNQPRCLLIDGALGNVTIMGAGMDATKLICRTYGDKDPLHYWPLDSTGQYVLRGHGIFVKGGIGWRGQPDHVAFIDFELNGGAGKGATFSYPANTTTGDGWDGQHQGITASNDRAVGTLVMERVRVQRFRGEMIYRGGGTQAYRAFVANCQIGDGNANCYNWQSNRVYIHRCAMYNSHSGIEAVMHSSDFATYDGLSPLGPTARYIIDSCEFFDMVGTGAGVIGGAVAGDRSFHVSNCIFRRCPTGVGVKASHAIVQNNHFVDCFVGVSVAVVSDAHLQSAETELHNMRVNGNTFHWYQASGRCAINCLGFSANNKIYDLDISDNFIDDRYANPSNLCTMAIEHWLVPGFFGRVHITRNVAYTRRGFGTDEPPGPGGCPIYRDNEEYITQEYGARFIAVATAGQQVAFQLPEHVIYSSGANGLSPTVNTAIYEEGTQIRLRGRTGYNTVTISADSASFHCEAARVLTADRLLTLEFRSGRFVEIGWSYRS